MKYAIISDIHSNPDALEKVLEDAWEHDTDKVVCLGDVVGYGPDPVRAVEIARNSCDVVLMGHTHVHNVWDWDEYLWDRFPNPVRNGGFTAAPGHRYVVNVGSVGYLRVENGSVYCLFDSDTGKVEFRRLPFDAEAYAEAVRAQGAEIPFWLEDMLKA